MTAVDAHEHGAHPLLEGRFRLDSNPGTPSSGPKLIHAYDQEADRAVTLLLLPASSSLRDRLALRLQVRRAAEGQHPNLAPVLDLVDTEATLAVVMPLLPGARLLADGAVLPEDGPQHLRAALEALHGVGRAHGALDDRAVLVMPDSTVLLLPLPPEPGALPEEDLQALERLSTRYGPGGEQVPPQRRAGSHARGAHALPRKPSTTPPAPAAYAHAGSARPWPPAVVRGAQVLCGALAGAALADVLSRIFG